MVWPSPGTDSPWVTTPDTITLTPAMIFAAGEGPQFLANEVTVTAVPEPSTFGLAAIAGLAALHASGSAAASTRPERPDCGEKR